MYVLLALAITGIIIALAWRGVGIANRPEDGSRRPADTGPSPRPPHSARPKPAPKRKVVAPDDDPDFLYEIDRKLREDGKKN